MALPHCCVWEKRKSCVWKFIKYLSYASLNKTFPSFLKDSVNQEGRPLCPCHTVWEKRKSCVWKFIKYFLPSLHTANLHIILYCIYIYIYFFFLLASRGRRGKWRTFITFWLLNKCPWRSRPTCAALKTTAGLTWTAVNRARRTTCRPTLKWKKTTIRHLLVVVLKCC